MRPTDLVYTISLEVIRSTALLFSILLILRGSSVLFSSGRSSRWASSIHKHTPPSAVDMIEQLGYRQLPFSPRLEKRNYNCRNKNGRLSLKKVSFFCILFANVPREEELANEQLILLFAYDLFSELTGKNSKALYLFKLYNKF